MEDEDKAALCISDQKLIMDIVKNKRGRNHMESFLFCLCVFMRFEAHFFELADFTFYFDSDLLRFQGQMIQNLYPVLRSSSG